MNDVTRLKYLKLALRIFGAVFIVALYPLTALWPSGWSWHVGHSEYLGMILAIYATLGVFLLLASRDPDRHLSLISFTIWSSIAHGGLMAIQSIADPRHVAHLYGDVPALFIVAAVFGCLSPAALTFRFGERSS